MPVRATDDILKRARQMEQARHAPAQQLQTPALDRRLDVLEAKIELVFHKLGMEQPQVNVLHEKILNELADWKSASALAVTMGYSHEHVTRRISDLKKHGHLEEKRSGKTILYKKKA